MQYELGYDQHAVDELRLANIRDPAIDQYTGVEKLEREHGRGTLRKKPAAQIATLLPAQNEAQITKDEKRRAFQERSCGLSHCGARKNQGNRERRENSQESPERSSQQIRSCCAAKTQFRKQDHERHHKAQASRDQRMKAERLEVVTQRRR